MPVRLMVDVAVKKQYYADYILVTHFELFLYLLKDEEAPVCIPCYGLCTAENRLTKCVDEVEWRKNFFNSTTEGVVP